jgi:hypothetical protein
VITFDSDISTGTAVEALVMLTASRGAGRLESKTEALDSKWASLAGTMIKASSAA